jgi:hypothetical protein
VTGNTRDGLLPGDTMLRAYRRTIRARQLWELVKRLEDIIDHTDWMQPSEAVQRYKARLIRVLDAIVRRA